MDLDYFGQKIRPPFKLPLYVQALESWERNIRKHRFSSFISESLDCDGFRILSKQGLEIFPFILAHLEAECKAQTIYDAHEDALKRRIFGSDGVFPCGEDYETIKKEPEYQELRRMYNSQIHGKPGHLWIPLVHKVIEEDRFNPRDLFPPTLHLFIPREIQGRTLEMMLFTRDWLRKQVQ